MARPTTEIVKVPLKPGIDIDDADSPAGKVLHDTFITLQQQDGFQRLHKGLQVENPSILQVYIDWDSIESHKKFMSQPYYEPFAQHMMSIVDGELDVCHANFTVHPPSASPNSEPAPVTEVVGHYFSTDISDSKKSSFESNVDKFGKVLVENAKGVKGFLGGWVVEELEHPKVEGKVRLWQSLIGWDSVEAHLAFRETDAFKDNVHLMRLEFTKAASMHHVKFQKI